MPTVREFLEKIKFDGCVRYDEPMSEHTTFRIGGPADAWVQPASSASLASLLTAARTQNVPFFLLGGGANLLVGDKGIRGMAVSMAGLSQIVRTDAGLRADAGASVEALVRAALDEGLAGLEFASGLPGSVGGAVFMNARCYDREFADVLSRIDYLSARGRLEFLAPDRREWAYKKTPFMPAGSLAGSAVLSAEFALTKGDPSAISKRMEELRADRTAKGHYDLPCAGSVFKNNRGFGRPTGKILDELGFRGRALGSAAVSPKHANIFVNPGAATAADMFALIHTAQSEVKARFGYDLEPEIVMVGDF